MHLVFVDVSKKASPYLRSYRFSSMSSSRGFIRGIFFLRVRHYKFDWNFCVWPRLIDYWVYCSMTCVIMWLLKMRIRPNYYL